MARNHWGKVILWIAGLKLSVKGRTELDFSVPRIYVANHSSYMDIPCLFAGLPVNLYFIAKAEVKKIPFVGVFMMATKMIFLDKASRQKSIKNMNNAGELIKKGKSVLVFPEGTRSRNGKLQNFKKGVFMLAYNSGLSVVPVYLKGTNQVMPSDALRVKPGLVQMTIGQPINSAEFSDIQLFIDHTREEMLTMQS